MVASKLLLAQRCHQNHILIPLQSLAWYIRIRHDREEIHRLTIDLLKIKAKEGSRARKDVLRQHATLGPDTNLYALVWSRRNYWLNS